MSFTVRPAVPADAAALAACAAVTFPLACPPSSDPRDIQRFLETELSESRFAERLGDPDRMILCVELHPPGDASDAAGSTKRGLGGYSMLVRTQPDDALIRGALTVLPAVELSKFYIDPAHHGAGAARALMEASLETAAGTGMPGIWLGVNQENERAIRFYSRSGFRIAGTKTFRLGGRLEDDYILERSLTGSFTGG
ncbi:GNAT family N-acetyltransferase [Arthrobacter crusticola]|uniref:GNAT family N-acetyltransferase n=1 Tax=Arthrobacter crusticola TaxID=2547960 RepID=A0A4R5TZ02_9MICC|nr:GNAT family N-acetyltransferase [Arthrobacter crusticola]TDK26489.1 GNAT family N-acetyltransferase [Arthrobacter crusticola]